MNAKELDKVLRMISINEQNYRNGKYKDYSKVYKTKIIDGKEVIYFSIDDLEYSAPVIAKKHSRFQTFPAHCHSSIEINYMYSGQCVQIINGKEYTLKEGQTLFLNYDTVHQIQPLGENDILLVLNIKKDYLNSNFFNRFSSESIVMNFFLNCLNDQVLHNNFLIFNSQFSERLRIFISEFMCEWYSPSLVSADITNSLLTLILSEIINVYKKDVSYYDTSPQNSTVIKILHYIENNYINCTLKDTAAFFNLNANYLSNLLKKHTGYTYKELIIHQKINAAKHLIKNSSLSISEISNQVGYQNLSFFYQKFEAQVGCLPGDYRKQHMTINSSP